MPLPRVQGLTRVVQAYYWLTPIFFVVSWSYGFDMRVPFLDALPGARAAYYVLSMACAGMVAFLPASTAIVARVESTLCASLLVVTTWAAWFNTITTAVENDGVVESPFTSETATSLALSAFIFIVSSVLQRAQGGRSAGILTRGWQSSNRVSWM